MYTMLCIPVDLPVSANTGYAPYFTSTFAYEIYYYGIYFYDIYFYSSILL